MKGSQKEFLDKINSHKGMIFKISKMYVEGKENQEDLFQEIVYQLWKSYESFRGESQFSTWVYRVSLNTAITFFKKEKRHEKSDLSYEPLQEDSFNEQKETQLELFYKAIPELNPIEKAIIFLYLEGMSHLEIANNLGITEVNARVKLNRTKNKLQQIIKSYGYEF